MSSSSGDTIDDEQTILFKKFKQEGREHLKSGQVKEALVCYQKAYKLIPDEKLKDKINKMETFLTTEADDEEGNDMVDVGNGFHLYVGIADKLYAYQREGLLWMWKLFLKKKGGVLGDDMGLGKTIQVISFLSGMFDADLIRSVLLIMPVSLIPNWKKEFDTWAPGIKVYDYYTGSKQEKERNLSRAQRRGGVLITSYGMLLHNSEQLSVSNGQKFAWCYLVLDEGHKIKNPTKTTKAVYEVPAKNRLVLTGTAIQNNLRELWALFNFTHQGTLLGSLATFKVQYENPVNRAREKDATVGERRLGIEIAQALRKKIEPFFLRRTKAEVLQDTENSDPDTKSLIPKLTFTAKKNDLVVWTFLSDLQKKIYKEFLESDEVANILMTRKSPLVQLTILKKICDHPRLLSKRACVQLGMHENMTQEEIEEFIDNDEGTAMDIASVSDETLLEESGKMMFVLHLLLQLKGSGHRTLFFSQSRKILDITQRILKNKGFKVTRLDGTVTKLTDRDRLVSQFQEREHYEVFLLTTQVGGVGLTLTAADRVIIYDPSWNPATDAQAVDRAYRIGQKKNVVVYRLVTCSTVEEKIYRRQIFKDSIIKQTTGKQRDPTRYFTKQELRELFTLDDPTYSNTQVQLEEKHSHDRKTDAGLESHIKFLQQNNIFGVSHHDLMFSAEEKECKPEEFVPGELEHVQRRVEQAERLVSVEAEMLLSEIQKDGNYTVPINIVVRSRQPGPSMPKPPNMFPIVVPEDVDGVPAVVAAQSTSIEQTIDVDSLGSINQTLGDLSIREANKSDSVIVECSDDELFQETRDGVPTSYVIEESDIDSGDEEETKDTRAAVKQEIVTQDVTRTEDHADSDILETIKKEPGMQDAVKSESSSRYSDSPLEEMVPAAVKEESASNVGKEPELSANSHMSKAMPTETEDFEIACPASNDLKEGVCRNLFQTEVGKKSPLMVFAGSNGDPEPFVRKRTYDSNLTPSPSQRITKHHAPSPLVHRTVLQNQPVHSPLYRRRELPSPVRDTTSTPETKPLNKPLRRASPVRSQGGRIHSTSTPVATSPRRITPLKVSFTANRKRYSPCVATMTPFQKAMATSLELSPEEQSTTEPTTSEPTIISDHSDDEESSPVIAGPRRRLNRVVSDDDTEDSDASPTSHHGIPVHDTSGNDSKHVVDAPGTGDRHNVILTSDESSSDDEMISENDEEGWENISQSLSSIE